MQGSRLARWLATSAWTGAGGSSKEAGEALQNALRSRVASMATHVPAAPSSGRLLGRQQELAKVQGKVVLCGSSWRFLASSPSSSSAAQPAKKLQEAASKAASAAGSLLGKKGSQALSLQAEAFWQRHSTRLTLALGAASAYAAWRLMLAAASLFAGPGQAAPGYGLAAAAAALVAAAALALRRRYVIQPEQVYQAAMLRLNSSPAVLEVMGAPVAGSDVRAYVVTGNAARTLPANLGLHPSRRSLITTSITPTSKKRSACKAGAGGQQARCRTQHGGGRRTQVDAAPAGADPLGCSFSCCPGSFMLQAAACASRTCSPGCGPSDCR